MIINVFLNVELIFNKSLSGNNCFQTCYVNLFQSKKLPDWKNFSHFSRFSSASGNPDMVTNCYLNNDVRLELLFSAMN